MVMVLSYSLSLPKKHQLPIFINSTQRRHRGIYLSRQSQPHRKGKSNSLLSEQALKMQNSNLGSGEIEYRVRKLEITDKRKGFIELLQQLTICDSVSDEEFDDRFQELSSLGDDHVICVIEDENSERIIATGSVFIEKKFLRNCGKVGHIEDVVVDASARGKHLGKKIIEFLTEHTLSMGCYKVILDCSLENKAFYEKCGFKPKEIQMVKYFI